MVSDLVITVPFNNQNSVWWNDTCAKVLEVFGLPGNRFTYTPCVDYMQFRFNTAEDAFLCKILLSDRLC